MTWAPADLERRTSRRLWIAVGGLMAVGAVLRALGASNDLWFDELWSIANLESATSALGVVTQIHHDNNHYLNSLWLFAMSGVSVDPLVLRLHVVVASVLGIFAMALAARRWGAFAAVASATMAAFSYLFIHYGSEARGYATLVLFSVLSFHLVDTRFRAPGPRGPFLFAVTAIGGFLSHANYVWVFGALFVWAAVKCLRHDGWRARLWALARFFSLPTLFVILLYVVDIRVVRRGGGPSLTPAQVILAVCTYLFGISSGASWLKIIVASVIWCGSVLVALRSLIAAKDDSWVFFGIMTLVVPVVCLTALPPVYRTPRMLLAPMAFWMLLMSYALERLRRRFAVGRWLVGLLALWFVFTNSEYTRQLIRVGRGNLLATASYLVARTPTQDVNVAVDDITELLAFQWYAPRFPEKTFVVEKLARGEAPTAEWLVVRRDHGPTWTTEDRRYVRVRAAGAAPMSGWKTFVYRRAGAQDGAGGAPGR